MTVTRGLALFLTVVAGRRARAARPAPRRTPLRQRPADSDHVARQRARARRSSSRPREPVAYVATRPDPLTLLLDFRNVAADERRPTRSRPTIEEPDRRACRSRPAESLGAPASRVRIALAQPVAHHVRSDRQHRRDRLRQAVGEGGAVRPGAARVQASGRARRDAALENAARRGSDRRARPRPPAGGPSAAPSPVGDARCRAPIGHGPRRAGSRSRRCRRRRRTTHDRSGEHRAQRPRSSPATRSASISRARICAPCCAPSPRSAASTSSIDPAVHGIGGRRAARRAVGSGARHHPARQQARLPRRRHHRPHRAARRCWPTKSRSAASSPTSRRSPASSSVLTKTLSYARAEELQALLTKSALSQRGTRAGRRAHEHADHHRPAATGSTTRQRAHRHARPRAAAGRDRSAHRPDQQELRARARRAVGLQRPRRSGARQHDATWRSRTTAALGGRVGGAGPAGDRRPADRRQPRASARRPARVGLALGSVNGAFNLDVALTALERTRQRPRCCRRRA